MNTFIPRGLVPLIEWLDERAREHFPERFEDATRDVTAREIGEALRQRATHPMSLYAQIAEVASQMAAVGSNNASTIRAPSEWVDWSAYNPEKPEHYPLKAGLRREEFEGAIVPESDPWPGEDDAPILRQVREYNARKMARDLAPKQELDRLRESVCRDLERARIAERAALRQETFEACRQSIVEGQSKAVAFDDETGTTDLIPPTWWGSAQALESVRDGEHRGARILIQAQNSSGPKSGRSNNAPVARCTDWLLSERRFTPERQPKSKKDYCEESRLKFIGLTRHGFNSAWKKAAEDYPAPGWGKPGRPRNEKPLV